MRRQAGSEDVLLGTSEDEINAWALDTRRALLAAKPESGTLAGDIDRFLDKLPDGTERKLNLATWLRRWRDSPLGQRSRTSITRSDVVDALDRWRAEGYAASSLNHLRQSLISLYKAFDGPEHACPARTVAQFKEPPGRRGFFERPQFDAILKLLPPDYADLAEFL